MYGGNSGCYGIVIFDTKKDKAIYGYYEEERIVLKSGTREEMKEFKSLHEGGAKKQKKKEHRIMGWLLLVMVLAVILTILMGTGRAIAAVLLFCVIAYMPLLVIFFANVGLYEDEADREAFRRYHGSEHALVYNLSKDREITLENLKRSPYYDAECGTAYSGYMVLLAAELAVLILIGPGLLRSILILAATLVLLLINVFNPLNPFLLLQKQVVARPSDREYSLAAAIGTKMKDV